MGALTYKKRPICPWCEAEYSIEDIAMNAIYHEAWDLYSEDDDDDHDVTCGSCDKEFTVKSTARWLFPTDEQEGE